MKIKLLPIEEVKENPENPRTFRKDKLERMKKSISDFQEMLDIRPIVVNDEKVVLGGNLRLKACQELGMTFIPVLFASELSEEQQKEFIIRDNVNFGEWDYDRLANEWDNSELNDWGMDVWNPVQDDEFAPKLEPSTGRVEVSDEELEREAEKMGKELRKGRERVFVECECPKCNSQFSVER